MMPRIARPHRDRCRTAALAFLIGALGACAGESTAPVPPHSSPIQQISPATTDNAVIVWDAAVLQAIRVSHMSAPVTARALAIVHTAIYDAWAAYDGQATGTQLGSALRRPASDRTAANRREAVSYAAHRALLDLFPAQASAFDASMTQLGYDPANQSMNATTPAGVGNVAAQAVLDARHHDGSNQLGDLHAGAYSDYTAYAPVNGPDAITDPNRWQPLRVGTSVQQFAMPQWSRVTPFALTSASQFRPVVLPNQYPRGGFKVEVNQILQYSRQLDDRTKVIAEYWADGPGSESPPGHWCLFAIWVSHRDHHTLDDDAKMFFAISNALLDASIAAWDSKRFFDSVRPITAVHFWKAGRMVRAWGGPYRGVIEMRGETWLPYQPANVVTPPFPEFISGHSIFSAASAEVLERFTGSDAFGASVVIPALSGRVEPGLVPATDITLAWPTFSAAADEAGLSRRYGGIHFVQGDLQSRAIGRLVGAQAWARAQRYFTGHAP